MPRKPIDLLNKTFGKLIVIAPSKKKKHYWICQCSCGNTTRVTSYNLMNGRVKSCGCLKNEHVNKLKLCYFKNHRGRNNGN